MAEKGNHIKLTSDPNNFSQNDESYGLEYVVDRLFLPDARMRIPMLTWDTPYSISIFGGSWIIILKNR